MKIHKRLKETSHSREYNILLQTLMCYNDGESFTRDWEYAVCSCLNHKRYWTKKESKRIKLYYQNRKSWKYYRKTQYKCVDKTIIE